MSSRNTSELSTEIALKGNFSSLRIFRMLDDDVWVHAHLSSGVHMHLYMHRKINHRLRSERRKWGLTQREMAPLLLIRNATQLCRIERGCRYPSAASVIASCLVFGRSVDQLFPGLRRRIHEQVGVRAHRLYEKVEKDKRPEAERKRAFLQAIASIDPSSCQ
jgi:DNA-binding XRE family transcriptional regulator